MTEPKRLRVSVVATVVNEGSQLPEWLRGLEWQTQPADEVIIVDGGSRDGTWEQLLAWRPPFPWQVLTLPGATIAEGRNHGIGRSTGEIVVITDAGTVADPTWLAKLIAAFDDPNVDVAAGGFRPVLMTSWQRALAAATLPDMAEIDGDSFLPSSRSVAIRRSWLAAGLTYPGWLDYCEDLVWDLALKRAGARFRFVPEAQVVFAPRPDLKSYWRQYFRYARGDGKAGLWRRRHLLRFCTYAALTILIARRKSPELLIAGVFGVLYTAPVLRRLRWRDQMAGLDLKASVKLAPLAVLLRAWGDFAKIAGYPTGLVWRLRERRVFGTRTSWQRVTPDGRLWLPGSKSKEIQRPRASRGGESHPAPR